MAVGHDEQPWPVNRSTTLGCRSAATAAPPAGEREQGGAAGQYRSTAPSEARDWEIEKLHAKIGRLTIENDFFAGGQNDDACGPQ